MLFNSFEEIENKTIYQVIKYYCLKNPDKPLLKFEKSKLNGTDFLNLIDNFANYLIKNKITKSDMVGILLPNCFESVALIYACNKIGAVAVMLNPIENEKMLLKQINLTNCKILFFSEISFQKTIYLAKNKKDLLLKSFSLFSYFNPITKIGGKIKFKTNTFKKQLKAFNHQTIKFSQQKFDFDNINNSVSKNDYALIIFSSGSTDSPKAIVHCSYSINCSAFSCVITQKENVKSSVSGCLSVLPVFHIFGFIVGIHISVVANIPITLVAMFNKEKVAKLFLKQNFEYFPGVPTIYIKLLSSKAFKKAIKKQNYNLSNFIRGYCGGDILPTQIQNQFNSFIKSGGGIGEIVQGYGLSEICPAAFCPKAEDVQSDVGLPFKGTQIKILSKKDDQIIPQQKNQEGDIYISSYGLFCGYYKNNKLDKSCFEQFDNSIWFKTKDRGYIDQNNHLHFVCRDNQMVKVSSNAVNLKQIEDKLNNCKIIHKAYVVAQKDLVKGNSIKAVVVVDKNYISQNNNYQKSALEIIKSYCLKNLNIWENPKTIILCDKKDIPLTATLKPDYNKIKNL